MLPLPSHRVLYCKSFTNLKPIVLAVGVACGVVSHGVSAAVAVNTASFTCANGAWTDSACWASGSTPREYQMLVYQGDKVEVLAYEDRQLNFALNRTVTISDLTLVNASNKVARIVHSAGTLQVQGSVAMNGQYILTGGELSVFGNVARDDFAYHNTGTLTVGISPNNNGPKFDLQDGTLNTTRTIVGYQGANATFNQLSGDHNVRYQLNVGYNDFLQHYGVMLHGTGTYNLSGGTLSAMTINVQGSAANYGYSAFNQSGGTANGSVNLNYGSYTMTGGKLNGSVSATAGDDGRSDFVQKSGTVTGGVSIYSGGHYVLSGGALYADSEYIAGTKTGGFYKDGSFVQSGGTNTTNKLTIGQFGSYTLTGGMLTVNGALTNDGAFLVTGGNFTVSGDVVNRGVWDVRSATMTYSGNTEFTSGSINNLDRGAIATYLGAVQLRTGAQLTGNGTRIYAGGLSVGNSPGSVTQAGNAEFASSNIYTAEIGGLLPGTGYDVFGVAGSLHFGGSLVITSWNNFTLNVGQTYDLFNWGSSTGQFASIDFSGLKLQDGTKLDTSRLYVDGTVTVTAVPEPESAAMLLLGLGVMGFAARRRQSAKSVKSHALN